MGTLLGFLRVMAKTECSKGANAESETDGILPPEIKGRSVIARSRINRSSRVSLKECVQLRSNTIGESVCMKLSVIAQTEPGTILLRSLRHGIFFAGGKVVP